jgi:hypothetical protein
MSRVCLLRIGLGLIFGLCPALLYSADHAEIGVIRQIDTLGTGEIVQKTTVNVGEPLPEPLLPPRSNEGIRNSRDTGVLWVDRAHLFAIAENTAISGDGMGVFSNWSLNNERMSYYRSLGDEVPLWTYEGEFRYSHPLGIGVSSDGGVLSATLTDEGMKWARTSWVPDWTYFYGPDATGMSTRTSRDGSRVAMVYLDAEGQGRLSVFDAITGALDWDAEFPEGSRFQGVTLSDDGSIVAVTVYDSCFVFEEGARRGQVPIGTSSSGTQYGAGISGDGTVLSTGDYQGWVKVYTYNGSSYESLWQAHSGHAWVTQTTVSGDGSTVMAGTYHYSPANMGKVMMFDTSSSTPLWTYENYGDLVPAVALSYDGSRGVAGCWGQYGSTFGEVLSVFDRDTSAPVFALWDDVDEPGSIFSVDISEDGSYVTCGGKAVHAREFGNGGEVYAILAGGVPAHNVAAQSLDSPGYDLEVGSSSTPEATFANYGDSAATFAVHFVIEDSLGEILYSDSSEVMDLAAGDEESVNFGSSWAPDNYGWYRFVTYCSYAPDGYAGDDTLTLQARCYHDAAARYVGSPFPEVTLYWPVEPRAVFENLGSYPDDFDVYCEIRDSSGGLVYQDSASTAVIWPDDTLAVTFSEWTPETLGTFQVMTWVELEDDYRPENDSSSTECESTLEILYDDGRFDIWMYVSSNFYDNAFGVRFTPVLDPPFLLDAARVYVYNDSPFALSVHMDSSVVPGKMLYGPDTLNASVYPGWAEHEFDSLVLEDSSDFWVLFHWMSATPYSPYVGADQTDPLDYRSYWYWTEPSDPGWHLWNSADFMIRARTEPLIGVDEDPPKERSGFRFSLSPGSPNPLRDGTSIRFEIHLRCEVEMSIYDESGRMVRGLLSGPMDPGSYRVSWDGRDGRGRTLPGGVYFCRLEAGSRTATRKMVVLR